jgi:peptidoglycan/xylan/chitin deacetylase (PgdA/CDA1 family)
MYHSISEGDGERSDSYYLTRCSPARFAEQIGFLHQNGYRTLSLSTAAFLLRSGKEVPPPAVVITFDDGFRNFYTSAFPVLSRYGFTATVFLPTGLIGTTSAMSFKGQECLTWDEVRELHRAGVEFGSHTVSHPQLKTLDTTSLIYELRESKATLEDELGCCVDSFCYPYAFPEQDFSFRQKLTGLLRECGYQRGVSTILGLASSRDDRFLLRRLPVSSRDDLCFLRAKLEGGYDWLHAFQYAAKLIRA